MKNTQLSLHHQNKAIIIYLIDVIFYKSVDKISQFLNVHRRQNFFIRFISVNFIFKNIFVFKVITVQGKYFKFKIK